MSLWLRSPRGLRDLSFLICKMGVLTVPTLRGCAGPQPFPEPGLGQDNLKWGCHHGHRHRHGRRPDSGFLSVQSLSCWSEAGDRGGQARLGAGWGSATALSKAPSERQLRLPQPRPPVTLLRGPQYLRQVTQPFALRSFPDCSSFLGFTSHSFLQERNREQMLHGAPSSAGRPTGGSSPGQRGQAAGDSTCSHLLPRLWQPGDDVL